MAKFDVIYDDFTGGHFVGPSQANQPKNTYSGVGVIATADEGFLMADGGWTRSSAIGASGGNRSMGLYHYGYLGSGFIGTTLEFGTFLTLGTNMFCITEAGAVSAAASLGFASVSPSLHSHLAMGGDGQVLAAGAGAAIAVMNGGGGSVTGSFSQGPSITPYYGVWHWKTWMIALDPTVAPNRLYFSDVFAADYQPATLWPTTNWVAVGDSDHQIEAIVTTKDEIILGTRAGWWSVSGVLGASTVVRRISKNGIDHRITSNAAPGLTAAESAVLGIVSATDPDKGLAALSGGVSTKVHHGPMGPSNAAVNAVVNIGSDLAVTAGTWVWHWSDKQRRWRVSLNPLNTGTQIPVEDVTGYSSYLQVVGQDAGQVYVYRALKEPVQPVSTAGAFDSATVTLAEFQGKDAFKVNEILVEVDFGQPAVQTGLRSLEVCAITNGIPDLSSTFPLAADGSPFLPQSTSFTKVWEDALATINGHREMVRFVVNDGAASTMTAAPKLTLKGVKVRRVIMRCEEV
jgi:hypothetical protein